MEKVCEQCAQSRPLQLFRRFAGRKKIMRSVCNVCDPPRTLKQMTKRQRAGEVAHGRVNWLIVAAMERQEHDAYRNSQAGTSLLTQRRLRREGQGKPVEDAGAVREALAQALRALDAIALEHLDGAGPEFALVLIRRDEIGCAEILAEVPEDIAQIERAARKLVG